MAKSLSNKRVAFSKGAQRRMFLHTMHKQNLNIKELAQVLKVHPRTLSDWCSEKATLPFPVYTKLKKLFSLRSFGTARILEQFWYTKIGATRGGIATWKKYGRVPGSESHRLERWREWWANEGKNSSVTIGKRKLARNIKPSVQLAELFGIMLGDGHLDSYQLTVTLNATADAAFAQYVAKLFSSELGVKSTTTRRQGTSVLVIRISSIAVIEQLIKFGLVRGNKVRQQVSVPLWIQESSQYATACIRGLWDTDGCVFEECHKIAGRQYSYPRMAFVNHSQPLLRFVNDVLKSMDFSPKIRNNRSVNLERREDILRYFKKVGTRNPKHQTRFESFV